MEIYDNIKAVCLALAGCVITSLAGCSGGQGEISLPRPFPVPEVPSIISSGEDAMEYLAMHYWDGYTDTSAFYPCDSTMVNGVPEKDLEQAFADWTSIILKTGPEQAGRAVSSLFDRISAVETKDTSSTVFETVSALAYKYFYDPNSPVRSEDLYLPFVSRMAAYGGFTPEQRMRYEYDARMCSLNRTGTPAADFTFSDGQGIPCCFSAIQAARPANTSSAGLNRIRYWAPWFLQADWQWPTYISTRTSSPGTNT